MNPGSWWVSKRTSQRLIVHPYPKAMMTDYKREGRHAIRHARNRGSDRLPCLLEGLSLYLAWLTPDELQGGWQRYRPARDTGRIPSWLRKPPRFNDFLYTPPDHEGLPFWVGLQNVRNGWLCLSGILETESVSTKYRPAGNLTVQEVVGHFDYGLQPWNTFFVPASEAVSRLKPKYDKIRKTVAEHILEGLEES